MTELNDHELLAEFARTGSEAAFATLTARHVNLVYSAALRFCGNLHHAEEITQAVFIILARKAGKLSPRIVLSGWLYQAARLTAANFVKGEIRRQHREQEAYMQSTLNETDAAAWVQIAPLLDEAMGHLGETDRNAVVLRFFENQTAAEVAATLKLTEAAAHKRVNRALEKLRKIFTKRGVRLSATLIAGTVSVNSVSAAPVGLATTISAVAITKGAAAGTSTLTLVKGALKIMAWTKAKTAIAVGVGVLLAAGTTTVVVKEIAPRFGFGNTDQYFLNMSDWNAFQKVPEYFIVRPTHFAKPARNGTDAMGSKDRAIGRNIDLETMIGYAYDFHNLTRTVLPSGKPSGEPIENFDFLVTAPGGMQRFQAEIKKQTGYTARKETRDVDALLLKVRNPNAPGLKTNNGNRSHQPDRKLFMDLPACPLVILANQIEHNLSIPVVDQTGLEGNYDVRLDWQQNHSDTARTKLRQAVLEQLGLELIPTNMRIEMLVVEKVK